MNRPSALRAIVAVMTLAFCFVLQPLHLRAQTVSASLQGSVTDSAGGAISNAKVTVHNTATGAKRLLVTDRAGRYIAPDLQPGPYEVTVEAPSFAAKVFSGILLNVGDAQRVDAPLAAGSVAETVNVTAGESLIQVASSSNSTLIDNKQVVELPLNNRQFYSLALLSPGAFQPAQTSTLGFRGGIVIAGANEITNLFTYNGIYNSDIGVAQPSYRPSVETIDEFRLLTGVYSAEYGHKSGGQVVIISKSGTNQIHGSAYEFNRNEWSDAKNYFTAAGLKTPRYRQNTFGGTFGGPIWKNRTFVFFGYEEQLINSAVSALGTVPTTGKFTGETNMLAGIFANGKVLYDPNTGLPLTPIAGSGSTGTYSLASIPTSEPINFSSVAALAGQEIANLGFLPAPATYATAHGTAPSNNYAFQENRIETMHEGTVKLDQKFSEKDSVSASFNVFEDPSFEPSNTLCGAYVLPNFGCYANQISTIFTSSYDRLLTDNLSNNLRAGFERLQQPRTQQDNYTIGSAYPGLPGGPYFNTPNYPNNLGLPNTGTGGEFSNVGGPTNLPQDRYDNHYQAADTLTWVHGAHTIKLGIDFLTAHTVNLYNSNTRGAFSVNDSSIAGLNGGGHVGSTGDSLADLLLGLTYTSSIGQTAYHSYQNVWSLDTFLQDDWKIKSNLTLNLGLRYEVDSPVYSPNNVLSNFNFSSQSFISANVNGSGKYLYNFDLNNFAPRVGFSYQPYNNDKTVLKGAFGVFYDMPLIYNGFLGLSNQAPFKIIPTLTSVASTVGNIGTIQLSNPFPSGTPYCQTGTQTGCAAGIAPVGVNPNYRTPYLTEWSLGIEQAVTKAIVLESTFFGSKGSKLSTNQPLNVVNPATYTNTTRAPNQSDRPFPNFAGVSRYDTNGYSEFASWQNSLKQTYANGLTFIIAYTFSKSVDSGSFFGDSSNSSGTLQDIYNPHAFHGLSDFNVKHRLVLSPVAELPFGKGKHFLNQGVPAKVFGGFQLSGIFQFQTGRPFTVSDASSNNSGYYESADLPNQVSDPNHGAPHTVAQWFNTAAFQLAPKFVVTNGVVTQVGQFGNEQRNAVVGPQYTDLDLTLARSFQMFERVKGQFRIESFNIFNHPNFFNPYGSAAQLGGGGYGSITQANNGREFQFSMRVIF